MDPAAYTCHLWPAVPRRSTTIRRSLIRTLVPLVILTGGSILAVTTIGAQSVVEDLSASLIERTADHTKTELRRFVAPVERAVSIARSWGDSGLLRGADTVALNRLFIPLLQATPQISSAMIANSDGVERLILKREDGTWVSRVVRIDSWDDMSVWTTWKTPSQLVDQRYELVPPYDPRQTNWFKGALALAKSNPDAIYWSPPYPLFTTKQPGLSASAALAVVALKPSEPPAQSDGDPNYEAGADAEVPDGGPSDAGAAGAVDAIDPDSEAGSAKDPDTEPLAAAEDSGPESLDDKPEEQTWVVAFDVRLADISAFTTKLAPTAGGHTTVFADDGRLLGLPRSPKFEADADRAAAILAPISDIGIPEVSAAFERFGQERVPDTTAIFDLEVDGATWWAGFEPFDVTPRLRLWIAVLVPAADFLGEANRQRTWIIGISLLALILAFLMVLWLARAYSKPLEALARQSARVRDLDLTAHEPVTSSLAEVRALSEAQQQMLAAVESFSRYVPVDVVRELVQRGEVAKIGGRDAELTLLFTDIRGFTSVAEGMAPQALAAHMATYFEAMLDVLNAHNATVDKFVGDAIVAFWGAPTEDPHHASNAVRCTMALAERVAELNELWETEGLPVLRTGFGLHTGSVVVGNLGAPERLAYTVIGDAVNVASRIEGLNRDYQTVILGSAAVRDADMASPPSHRSSAVWRHVDRVVVKGRREPLDVYEIAVESAAAGTSTDLDGQVPGAQPD